MAIQDQLAAIAKAKGKRLDQVSLTDLTGAGMNFGDAQSAIMNAASAPPKAAPAYVPAGPTPDSQKLGADLMNRAIATGMTSAANIQKNATQQKIDMGKQFGSNPITGVYNPVSGLGNAAKMSAEAEKPATPPAPSGGGVATFKPLGTVVQPTVAPATPATPAPPTTIAPKTLSPVAQKLWETVYAKAQSTPVTSEQIMNSPEYKAQQEAIRFNRDVAQAANRRALSSRNMLRSTPAIQALENSNAYYTAQENALVPQMVETAARRQQQELNNYRNLYGDYMAQENQLFNQGVSEFNAFAPYKYETASSLAQRTDRQKEFDYGKERDVKADARLEKQDTRLDAKDARDLATARATFTGSLFLPEDKPILDEAIAAKGEYEALRGQGVPADDPRLVALSLKANTARAKLGSLGYSNIDELIGSGVSAAQAQANAGKIGYTQKADPKAKAELQKIQAEAELAQLKVDAQNLTNIINSAPGTGLAAQAAMERNEKLARISQIEASTDASWASADSSRASADNSRANAAKTRKEMEEGKPDPERGDRISDNVKRYNIERSTSEFWDDFKALTQGKGMSAEQEAALFQKMKGNVKLQPSDETWLNLIYGAANGDTTMQNTLQAWEREYQENQRKNPYGIPGK